MQKILIVGGNGFIGKNVTEYVAKKGYDVIVYDMQKSIFPEVQSYIGNLKDDPEYEKIIADSDIVVYLISAIMPKQSMEEPLSSYGTDIPLLIKTLEYCKKYGVKRIIYASSGGTIYGDHAFANTEELVTYPINHYAICKLTCEKILLLYNQLYDMENVILRIANPFGPYQRIASGVGAVTTFTCHVVNGEKISVWGDGENVRDYIDVRYVAEAFELAVKWNFDKTIVPVFNIGSGMGISLNQLIKLIQEETGRLASVEYLPKRDFDVKSNFLNITKANQTLGFVGDKLPEQSIRKFVRYCISQLENQL